MIYTQYDREILADVSGLSIQIYNQQTLALSAFVAAGLGPGGAPPPSRDTVRFQFPPEIASDDRTMDWSEDKVRGYEPVSIFQGSGPRTITMNWRYIVDGGEWDIETIQEQVRFLRGYAALVSTLTGGGDTPLVVKMKIWGIGHQKGQADDPEVTARIAEIKIKHGRTLVGTPPLVYPLRTDISAVFKIWTMQVGVKKAWETQQTTVPGAENKPPKGAAQWAKGLQASVPPAWY